jgi:hypothetical protein
LGDYSEAEKQKKPPRYAGVWGIFPQNEKKQKNSQNRIVEKLGKTRKKYAFLQKS